MSRNKIRGMALEEGGRIEQWEEERTRQIFEEGQEVGGIVGKVPKVLHIQLYSGGWYWGQ